MAEKYVTLQEAADLERISYETMKKRVQRGDSSQILKTKSLSGGKDTIQVAVTSLSFPARKAWRERENLKKMAEALPAEPEAPPLEVEPWYVSTDLDWYMSTYKGHYNKGMDLCNVVETYLKYDGPDKTGYAEDYAREHLGKNARTLYRYVKLYLEASAWAAYLQENDGGNYNYLKVLCLCRKPKDLGMFPSLSEELKGAIAGIWFDKNFAANQGTVEMLYEKLIFVAEANGWGKLPSRQTVGRYIKFLMEEKNLKNARYLASNGLREYKNQVMVKGGRDTKSLPVMGIVMGDTHTFDFWAAYTDRNGEVKEIRPKLIAWIDVRSRVVMGDVICKDVNADILKQSLLKMMFSDPGGVPMKLYIDNGKDYTAKEMTGKNRKDRTDIAQYMDEKTEGFYRSIGTKEVHRALPYQPWLKGQVERFFETVCNRFSKWMKSYTGTLTGSKTSAKVDKDIKGMAARGELLTMEQVYEKWHYWLTEVYLKTPHSGLKAAGEEYTTPLECFWNEERFFEPVPTKSQCRLIMMKTDNAYVYNVGIKRWGHEYRSDELCDYIGRKVDVKYDPNDVSTLYVYSNGRKVCEAYCQELLDFAEVSENVLRHIQLQKNQLKRDRERLKAISDSIPKGFHESFGGLMEGNKPKQKVLRFPENPEQREEMRRKYADNDYITAQGEEVLKQFRKKGG